MSYTCPIFFGLIGGAGAALGVTGLARIHSLPRPACLRVYATMEMYMFRDDPMSKWSEIIGAGHPRGATAAASLSKGLNGSLAQKFYDGCGSSALPPRPPAGKISGPPSIHLYHGIPPRVYFHRGKGRECEQSGKQKRPIIKQAP